jgi:hypothetical protein
VGSCETTNISIHVFSKYQGSGRYGGWGKGESVVHRRRIPIFDTSCEMRFYDKGLFLGDNRLLVFSLPANPQAI